jgi:hypothetical protein
MRELDDITGVSVQAKQLLTYLKLTNMPVGLPETSVPPPCARGYIASSTRSRFRVSASPREPISTGYQGCAASLTSLSVTLIPLVSGEDPEDISTARGRRGPRSNHDFQHEGIWFLCVLGVLRGLDVCS